MRIILILTNGKLEDNNCEIFTCGMHNKNYFKHYVKQIIETYQKKWIVDEKFEWNDKLIHQIKSLMKEWRNEQEFIKVLDQEIMHDEVDYQHLYKICSKIKQKVTRIENCKNQDKKYNKYKTGLMKKESLFKFLSNWLTDENLRYYQQTCF